MIIEIKRELIPCSDHQWAREPFEQTVWFFDGLSAHATKLPVLESYAPGLLRGYVDGRRVSLPELDEALKTLCLTRQDIEDAIL